MSGCKTCRLVALGTPAELARQLGRKQRLKIEVAPDTLEDALTTLAQRPEAGEITDQDRVITINGVSREMIPQLIIDLAAAGVRIYQVRPDEPSLEDVYFALHDHQEAAP
jgi:ABC-2 type transport system ATP-binding protein